MTKQKVLKLLQELFRDATIMQTQADDPSGCHTKYYVDQEQLMRNIEAQLEDASKCEECGGLGETADNSPCHKCHGDG